MKNINTIQSRLMNFIQKYIITETKVTLKGTSLPL